MSPVHYLAHAYDAQGGLEKTAACGVQVRRGVGNTDKVEYVTCKGCKAQLVGARS